MLSADRLEDTLRFIGIIAAAASATAITGAGIARSEGAAQTPVAQRDVHTDG